eukprot:2370164-Prymnesium_polylepis.1
MSNCTSTASRLTTVAPRSAAPHADMVQTKTFAATTTSHSSFAFAGASFAIDVRYMLHGMAKTALYSGRNLSETQEKLTRSTRHQ